MNYSRDHTIRDLKIKFGNPSVSLKYEETVQLSTERLPAKKIQSS